MFSSATQPPRGPPRGPPQRHNFVVSAITWPTSAILSKISKKNKVEYRYEMDRNEIESDFQTSKMATGSHFVKKKNKSVLI